MTVVKTNLYWVLRTLVTIGLISVNSLIAQCTLNPGDTLKIMLPLGYCELSNPALLDSLHAGNCSDAFSVFPSGPFGLNSTTPLQIFNQANASIKSIFLQVLPYELLSYPTSGSAATLLDDFIKYDLAAGECVANKELLLDQLKVPDDPIIRSQILFYEGPTRITNFTIGDTVYIDRVECNGYTYWENIKVLFQPSFSTNPEILYFDIGLSTCPVTIEDVLELLGYDIADCGIGRFDISDPGPFAYGQYFIDYIKLDEFYIVKDDILTVSPNCPPNLLDFDTLSPDQCYLDEGDIINKLGFTICDPTLITLDPPGPYLDTLFTIKKVKVGGKDVCSNIMVQYKRSNNFNELSSLFCNNYLNISLNTDCALELNAETLLQGGPYCYLNYIVSARDKDGKLVDEGHEIRITSPGTYTVSVANPRTGNSCWGTIVVEDKFIYDVRCTPSTVMCYDNNDLRPDKLTGGGPDFPDVGEPADWELTELPNFYLVNTGNACGIHYAFYVDVVVEECVDNSAGSFKNIIHRHWEFEDLSGNTDTCIQKIYVERTGLGNVVVDPFTANCLDEFSLLDNKNNPLPAETGYPRMIGTNHRADVCGTLKMTYNDTRFPLCGKSVKIVREWLLIDWCNNMVKGYNQVILIEDTLAPVFLIDLEDIYVENATFLCGVSDLEIPAPYYSDCGSDKIDLEIIYEDYDFYGDKVLKSNGSSLFIPSLTMHGYEGEFKIFYYLTDECGNTNSDSITVYVRDTEAPIAVCDEFTAVSVGGSGLAQVRALTFDDLSVDNCEIVDYSVRKLGGSCYVDGVFSDVIGFCCEEIGDTILVEFKVTDAAGNYNTCMVSVLVQDKFPPQIYCPDDVIIDCQDDPNNLTLTGEATAIDNCSFVEITYDDDPYLNDCGEGYILRQWKAIDRGGFERLCTQRITVLESEPFTMTPSRWPADVFLTGCGADLSPEGTGIPVIGTGSCSNVAYSHKDAYFNTVDGACFKIVREWTVIDWCRYGQNASDEGIWRKSQIIKVENDVAPEFFNLPQDTTLCLFGPGCFDEITIEVDAFDDCSAPFDLLWYSELYEADYMATPIKTSTSNKITDFLEPGEYVAVFRVSDGCGNVNTHELNITLKDCEPPVAECPPFAPSVVLGSNGQIALWISDFNLKGNDNCTPKEKLIYSFAPDSIVNSVIFTCADIADGTSSERFIRFYAIDEAGNSGYCEMELEINDSSLDLCADKDSLVVTGLILTEELGNVDNVEVVLNTGAATAASLTTDLSGTYAFRDLDEGADYRLSLQKEGRIDDGLTTFDLVLIARHAVGLKKLESPYKIIAADVDNSQNVSARDLVWLRQIILGTVSEFPNGQKNWRFVDERHEFPNPQRPWPFPEEINLNGITQSQLAKNFVAVKIGDVNGTNEASKRATSGGRSKRTESIWIEDVLLQKGQQIEVPVYAKNPIDLVGLQLTLDLSKKNALKLEGIRSGSLEIGQSNYHYNEKTGLLNISWNTMSASKRLSDEDMMFSLLLRSTVEEPLSQLISIDDNGLTPELIDEDLQTAYVDLRFEPQRITETLPHLVITDNRPNPFISTTQLHFELGQPSIVKFDFYDVSGRLLYQTENHFEAGQNELKITSENLQNQMGIIIAKIYTPWASASRKMTRLK